MKITVDPFDVSSINNAIRQLSDYEKSLSKKSEELCERLADMGAMYAEWYFSGVMYAGDIDYKVTVDRVSESVYRIKAGGETVLFMEFGAGVRHGYGHPLAEQFGMGPGTYNPSSNNWSNPNGWWFYQGSSRQSIHTYGNAPGMPMYNAAKDLRKEILAIAREVFRT